MSNLANRTPGSKSTRDPTDWGNDPKSRHGDDAEVCRHSLDAPLIFA